MKKLDIWRDRDDEYRIYWLVEGDQGGCVGDAPNTRFDLDKLRADYARAEGDKRIELLDEIEYWVVHQTVAALKPSKDAEGSGGRRRLPRETLCALHARHSRTP